MKQKIKKRRILPAIAAAAAAALCMGIGAAAYGYYHKESVQKYLGITGEELLAEYGNSAAQTFTGESAVFTVDTLLYDGHSALAVVTVEALDSDYIFPHDDCIPPDYLCDETGRLIEPDTEKYQVSYVSFSFWNVDDLPANQCRFVMEFRNVEDWNGETLYFRYAMPDEPEYADAGNLLHRAKGRELLDGLTVSFTMEQNCDCCTMQAENGTQVQLSAFDLLVDTANMDVSSERDAVETLHDSSYKLIYQDGTEQEIVGYSVFLDEKRTSVASMLLATTYQEADENFTVVFRTEEIAAIEINGIRYDKT